MTNGIFGTTWYHRANHYTDFVVREKVHVDAACFFIFLHFDYFLFHDVFMPLRHIPSDQNLHTWIPCTRNGSATDIGDALSPTIHISAAGAIYCGRINVVTCMVNNAYLSSGPVARLRLRLMQRATRDSYRRGDGE